MVPSAAVMSEVCVEDGGKAKAILSVEAGGVAGCRGATRDTSEVDAEHIFRDVDLLRARPIGYDTNHFHRCTWININCKTT